MKAPILSSLTRIVDLPSWPYPFEPLGPSSWENGDVVVGEVRPYRGRVDGVELPSGRICMPMPGDLVVGAFGVRFATLELTGTYEAIGDDGLMDCLTEGGCFGAVTSRSHFAQPAMPLRYLGHILAGGGKLNMSSCVPTVPDRPFDLPVILLVGTSMSAGKTYSGRVAVRELKRMGHTVVAAKLTGACRRHDTLTFLDAGADFIFDFVDGGLPTSIVPPEDFRRAIGGVLSRMSSTGATVAVVEAGASPLEPYNGGTLADMLKDTVKLTILAASDPYAVVGIQAAWERPFDLVCGPTANTRAGVALVRRLSGLEAIDLMESSNHGALAELLEERVGAAPA